MARLNWRPDRYRMPNCDDCGIMPAVAGSLCVKCHYARWQAEQAKCGVVASEEQTRQTLGLTSVKALDTGNVPIS